MEAQDTSTPLKQSHKELYGRLMLINQRIKDAGTFFGFYMLLVGIVFCLSVHMHWFDDLTGICMDKLRGFTFYLLVIVVLIGISGQLIDMRENMVYRAARPQLIDTLSNSDISLERLLAELANDKEVAAIKEKLMQDKYLQEMEYGMSS